jgi:hypothetical protein
VVEVGAEVEENGEDDGERGQGAEVVEAAGLHAAIAGAPEDGVEAEEPDEQHGGDRALHHADEEIDGPVDAVLLDAALPVELDRREGEDDHRIEGPDEDARGAGEGVVGMDAEDAQHKVVVLELLPVGRPGLVVIVR